MKIIKIVLVIILVLGIGGFIAIKYFSEDKPDGKAGTEADKVAQLMLDRLNKTAFDQIPYLTFEFFRGDHKYIWDKKDNNAVIMWGENKVVLNLDSQVGVVYKNNTKAEGKDAEDIKQKSWSYWCNDSFWMIAPFKVFDPGTVRSLVDVEEGTYGLLIEYKTGGVTPGDSYLWILDDNYQPTGYKMWTQILPVQGMYVDWSDWQDHMGAQLCISHTMVGKKVSMGNVKAGNTLAEIGINENPFTVLQ
jgi:hypothetical protein